MLKKLSLLLITIISAINLVWAQNDWVTYKIDNKLSVKMPITPSKAGEFTAFAQSKDSLFCSASSVDMQKIAGMDSARLSSLAPTDQFIAGIKNGMLGKMPGVTLNRFDPGKWNGYYCYSIEASQTEKKVKVYILAIIIGSNLYSLTAVMPDNHTIKEKDYYFNSLALN